MILAPFSDPLLRVTVGRAALPEEDVFHRPEDVEEALHLGFPRVLLYSPEDRFRFDRLATVANRRVPTLAITRANLRSWEAAWHADGLAVSRIDDSALRLRGLIRRTAGTSTWVEGLLADLTLLLGRGLPLELRGFGRRALEFPSRYASLDSLARVADLSPGALKARFRRRDLPSPARYLRWFRIMAAARILADPSETTLTASHRMGFSSDGNFCRWSYSVAGMTPSRLRDPGSRTHLLLRFVDRCLPPGSLERWGELDGLFLREVA